jgi:hypothetical protein
MNGPQRDEEKNCIEYKGVFGDRTKYFRKGNPLDRKFTPQLYEV